jgi:hypothetical protein
MGIMTIFIAEQYVVGTGLHGDVDTVTETYSACLGKWSVTVTSTSSLWVEFSLSDAFCTIERADGSTFVNGELIAANTEYLISITSFKSGSGKHNSNQSQVLCSVKNTEAGSVINSSVMTRIHAGLACSTL